MANGDARYNCGDVCPGGWPYGCSGGWNGLALLRCKGGGCQYMTEDQVKVGNIGHPDWCMYRNFSAPASTATYVPPSQPSSPQPAPTGSGSSSTPSPSPSPGCTRAPPSVTTPSIPVLPAAPTFTVKKMPFNEGNEEEFLASFESLISDSYAESNNVSSAPRNLTQFCRNQGLFFNNSDTLDEVEISGNGDNVVFPSEVSAQCGSSKICVIKAGLTLKMKGSLNVAALKIKGTLLWTGVEQTEEDQWLCAGMIAVESGGTFRLDLSTSHTKRAWVYIKDNGVKHHTLGTRVFGADGTSSAATIEISGRPLRRTWSLLAKPLLAGSSSLTLMHDPQAMGWRVGDRILVGPMLKQSSGQAQAFRVVAFGPYNRVDLDSVAIPLKVGKHNNQLSRKLQASFESTFESIPLGDTRQASLRTAEVVDLTRNVIITGDDFREIPCDPTLKGGDHRSDVGCKCSGKNKHCTMGLHTIHMKQGKTRIRHTRVEKCGQRGILAKYCMHFHLMGDCPECLAEGNAIEFGMQRAVVIHGTHRSLVTENVVNDVRGAAIYVEDGNEMYNTISYNVLICPWALNDPYKGGCTVPGTPNGQSDTALNQVGIWLTGSRNNMIGNRASNSFNGMLLDVGHGGTGIGAVRGQLCYVGTQRFGRFDGNTFHSHGRFGTYGLGSLFPKKTISQSVASNGVTKTTSQCSSFTSDGYDNGWPGTFNNNFDYYNTFVGHYGAGDVQYRKHASIENLNLIYWKDSKSFADGCSALLKDGFYRKGNLALPDEGAFLLENLVLSDGAGLEANHHCHVGVTGSLCMPTYIFVNTKRYESNSVWAYFGGGSKNPASHNSNYGGIFVLSPPDCTENQKRSSEGAVSAKSFFPAGYCSLVNYRYDYLLQHSQGQPLCTKAKDMQNAVPGKHGGDMMKRYNDGILCKVPLSTLKVYSKGLFDKSKAVKPALHVQFWRNHTGANAGPADLWFDIPYHQIGDAYDTKKQGYSFPVVPLVAESPNHQYRLALKEDGVIKNLPSDWIIEFSDPIYGNRWEAERLKLTVKGRSCPSITTSQHDRRFLQGTSVNTNYAQRWGHGACTSFPDMPPINCASVRPALPTDCPEMCPDGCGENAYCDCGAKKCICNAGSVSIINGTKYVNHNDPGTCNLDLCGAARCSGHGVCTASFLGGDLPVSQKACICEEPWTGPLCDQNVCNEPGAATCGGHGKCVPAGGRSTKCQCQEGYSGANCSTSCDAQCKGTYPYGCAGDVSGQVHLRCNAGGGCSYGSDYNNGWCSYKIKTQVSVNDEVCKTDNDCQYDGVWNCTSGNCTGGVNRPDGTPCNSKAFGTCTSGECVAQAASSATKGAMAPTLPSCQDDPTPSALATVGRGDGDAECLQMKSTIVPQAREWQNELTVTCCNTTGNAKIRKGNNSECYPRAKNFTEAKAICQDHGGRLCTKDEIESRIAKGKGCSIDNFYTWTSDRCECVLQNASTSAAAHGGAVSEEVNLEIKLEQHSYSAHITISGPSKSNVWFGVGLDATSMANTPYAIIVHGNGDIVERRLRNHEPGFQVSASVTLVSVEVSNGRRTVVLKRPLQGATVNHYSFNATAPSTLNYIYAVGYDRKLAFHKNYGYKSVDVQVETKTCFPSAYILLGSGDGSKYCTRHNETVTSQVPDTRNNLSVSCCGTNVNDTSANKIRKTQADVCHPNSVSYTEAKGYCEILGYHLCSAQELESGVGKGKGCEGNHHMHWTSTQCGCYVPPPPTVTYATKQFATTTVAPAPTATVCDRTHSALLRLGNGVGNTTCQHQDSTSAGNLQTSVTCCDTSHGRMRRDNQNACFPRGVTLSAAEGICENNGGRLCTSSEIAQAIASGKGCDGDNYFTWTSDQCDPNPELGRITAKGDGTGNSSCTQVNETSRSDVTCCGGSGNIRKNSSNLCFPSAVTYKEASRLCQISGRHLCTISEIKAGVAKGKGCNGDSRMTWTSEVCTCLTELNRDGTQTTTLTPSSATTVAGVPACETDPTPSAMVTIGRGGGRADCLRANERVSPTQSSWNNNITVTCCGTDHGSMRKTKLGVYFPSGKTFAEARALCQYDGGRLCTLDEIQTQELASGKGGGVDGWMTWTSDRCDCIAPPKPECPKNVSTSSFGLPDISFSNPNNTWVLSTPGANPPRIECNKLIITASPDRYRKATLHVNMPAEIGGSNNLYFLADVHLNMTHCPITSHTKPKMGILKGSTTSTYIDQTFLPTDANGLRFVSGVAINGYRGQMQKMSLTSMTFEIATHFCEGTMVISNPRLSNVLPSFPVNHPYPDVKGDGVAIDINSSTTKPWNPRIFSANSQFIFTAHKLGGGYENPKVQNLLESAKLPQLRFPGGKGANYYNWRTDAFYNDSWTYESTARGKAVERGFKFRFDKFCETQVKLNSSATLVFNVIKDSIQDAVDRLKDRLNCGLKIDYIELGNENMYLTQSQGHAGGKNVTKYIMWTKQIVAALKAVKSDLKFTVPIHHHSEYNPNEWNGMLAKENYFQATCMHPYHTTESAIFSTVTVKSLFNAKVSLDHYVKDYLKGGFKGIPMIFTEWGINYGNTNPWGMEGKWAMSISEADMMIGIMALSHRGVIDQAGKHILVTSGGHGFYKWVENAFVATPNAIWYQKFLEAARGGKSVLTTVRSPMLSKELPGVTASTFKQGKDYKVLIVNKLNTDASVTVTVDNSLIHDGTERNCSTQIVGYGLDQWKFFPLNETESAWSSPVVTGCSKVTVPRLSIAVSTVITPPPPGCNEDPTPSAMVTVGSGDGASECLRTNAWVSPSNLNHRNNITVTCCGTGDKPTRKDSTNVCFPSGKTYTEAQTMCKALDGRLCTLDEIQTQKLARAQGAAVIRFRHGRPIDATVLPHQSLSAQRTYRPRVSACQIFPSATQTILGC